MSDRFDFLELDSARARRRSGEPAPARTPDCGDEPPTPQWKVVELIGGPGPGAGQFAAPGGLAVDRDGNLFVANSYNHRIQRITPDGGVTVLGCRGTRPGEFLNPQAVVMDGGLGFYVLEQGGCRIQRFGPDGEWLGVFGSSAADGRRCGRRWRWPGPLAAPCSWRTAAITGSSSGRPTMFVWRPTPLRLLRCWPVRRGSRWTLPAGIWVSETQAHRLLVLDALFRPLATIGSPGEGPGQFREPQDLDIDVAGGLLVADTGNHRVQALDLQGAPLQVLERLSAANAQPAALNSPSGVAVTSDSEAYVADTGNHRILRLERQA